MVVVVIVVVVVVVLVVSSSSAVALSIILINVDNCFNFVSFKTASKHYLSRMNTIWGFRGVPPSMHTKLVSSQQNMM